MSVSRNPNLGVGATVADIPARSDEDPAGAWRKNLGRTRMALCLPRPDSWWSGPTPARCPGFVDGKLHSLPMPDLATCSRRSVLDYFDNTWTLNELLFSSLIGEEPFYRPPYHDLRHPLVFYYVHPSVLYVSKLRLAGLLDGPINSYFESLFETGVDEMSWDDMSKNVIEWPSLDDCRQYRGEVYRIVRSVIENHPALADGHQPIDQQHPLWALFMGFEHERIHIETSSVLIRELPVHLVAQPDQWPDLPPLEDASSGAERRMPGGDLPVNKFHRIDARTVAMGKPLDFPSYGWDNEYGERRLDVAAFEVSTLLVSNGEYWQFVNDGGYHDRENWSEIGWRWRSFRNVKWPTFWVPAGPAGSHQYRLRTCFEIIPMQWTWPAVVNFHEATAFCKWKSRSERQADGQSVQTYRLITEAEHHVMRLEAGLSESAPAESFNNNLRWGSESPVSGQGEQLFPDLFGNVWQWCEDHFNPLDGFKVHRYYDDFSTPCFDGEHQMIMGGSFISTGDEASAWARFHFRPHFFQHVGFRIVRGSSATAGGVVHLRRGQGGSVSTVAADSADGDAAASFERAMIQHYGAPELQMPFENGPCEAVNFPQRCADLLTTWSRKLGLAVDRALDVGCAVGGATFRLAETYSRVVGVDISEPFIAAASELKRTHSLRFEAKVEGVLRSEQVAQVPAAAAERALFRQADAGCLPADMVDFDAVLLNGVLDCLPSPGSCLRRMWGGRGIVRSGGLLLVVSTYDWRENRTPREVWLGGTVDEQGLELRSEDGLKKLLAEDFDLLEQRDMPFIERQDGRHFRYSVAQATVWRRR
ncbi:MAG: 5-histidylcysteine sulfoxide synthase [Cyanobacteria bacterium SZAS TMP-1]|nr:5-histidylcysteine sulfoxide synthase [Cyanobacteria bacterium SZAS TMP-1]